MSILIFFILTSFTMEAVPTFEWSRSPNDQDRTIFRFINRIVEQRHKYRRYCMATLFRAVLRRNNRERYTYGLAVQCLSRTLDSLNHAWDLRREEFVPIPPPPGQQQAPGECPICLEGYEACAQSGNHPANKGHYRVQSRTCGHTFGSGCILHAMGPFGAGKGTCPYCRKRWAGGLGSAPIVVEGVGDLGLPDDEQLYQIALDLHLLYSSLLSNPPDWLTAAYRAWLDRESTRLIKVRHPDKRIRKLSWTNRNNGTFPDRTLDEDFLRAQTWLQTNRGSTGPVVDFSDAWDNDHRNMGFAATQHVDRSVIISDTQPRRLVARATLVDLRQTATSDLRSVVNLQDGTPSSHRASVGLNHSPVNLHPIVNIPSRNEPPRSGHPNNDRSPNDSQVDESDMEGSPTAQASSSQSRTSSMTRESVHHDDTSPGPIITPDGLDSTQRHARAVTTSPAGLSPLTWHAIPPQGYDGTDSISSIGRFVTESQHFDMYRDDAAFRNALHTFQGTFPDPDNDLPDDQSTP